MAQDWLNVSDTTPRISYTVGSTPRTAFPVPFVFFENKDLTVYVDNVRKSLNVHYTVAGANVEAGGTVTFLTALTNCKVKIVRSVAIELDTHIPLFGPLDVPGVNLQFSRFTAIQQDLKDLLGRSIVINDADSNSITMLPPAAQRALKSLSFDSLGNPTVTTPLIGGASVSAAMIPVIASATLDVAKSLLFESDNTSSIISNGSMLNVQNSPLKSTDLYNPVVPPGWFTYDGVRSVVDVPAGTTATNVNAFGYYLRDRVATGGLGKNAVGMYGLAIADADGASVWGLNPVASDNPTIGIVTQGARTLIGAEFDFAVNASSTLVQGISLLGTALIQPAGADGFTVGPLSSQSPGLTKWTNGFVVGNGTSLTAMYIGASEDSGSNIPSSILRMAYFNASAIGESVGIFASTTGIYLRNSAGGNNLVLGHSAAGTSPFIAAEGTDANISIRLIAKGTGGVIAPALDVTNNATIRGILFTSDPNFLLRGTAPLSNGSGGGTGSLLNAPINGNPTKWLPYDDGGTVRYIPAW